MPIRFSPKINESGGILTNKSFLAPILGGCLIQGLIFVLQ